ncbi:MAG TPA: BatA domain-containing protein [Chthoniobacterales bacterium]
MTWLLPAFLGAGALIGLPILLHLLRRKPQKHIPFPSLRFLGPSTLRETKKHRILRWIVLILRCLAIAALAAGFARPFFGQKINPHASGVIVAIDNSFSMQAGNRWADLKNWAIDRLSVLRDGDQAGLLLMHPSPHWLVKMTPDLAAVRAALEKLQPGYETTRYRPALLATGEILKSLPVAKRELVWMADEQRIGWNGVDFSQTLPPGVMLTLPPELPPVNRQSSVSIARIRRSSVELKLRNFSDTEDHRLLSLFVNGQKNGEFPVSLPGNASGNRIFPIQISQEGPFTIQAALDPDDLAADDTAYGIGDSTRGQTVFLAPANEPDFVAHAVKATQSLSYPLRAEPIPQNKWPTRFVAILRGDTVFRPPYLAALEEFAKNGGNAWVMVDGSLLQKDWLKRQGITITPLSEPGHLQNWDITHPILAAFTESHALQSLLELSFDKGWAISGVEPLAKWRDGSIAVGILETGHSRLLITGFDTSRASGSFPLKTAFVPLVHQALTWLAPTREADDFHVGQAIPLPAETGKLSINGKPSVQAGNSFTPTVPGIYEFSSASGIKLFAVNISEDESDPTLWPKLDDLAKLQSLEPPKTAPSATASVTLTGLEAEQRTSLWWWLLAAAMLFLIVETGLSNRTIP